DAVIDAVYRIEPEIWLKQSGAIKLGEQTGRNLLFGYANLERLGAIDVNLERRIVQRLGNPEIGQARNAAQLVFELRGQCVVGAQVGSGDLHIDHRRETEIQNLANDIGSLEVAYHLGKADRQHPPNLILIHRRGAMLRLELYQYVSVLSRDAIGLVISKVVRNWDADVVADAFELVGRDDPADRAFHPLHD